MTGALTTDDVETLYVRLGQSLTTLAYLVCGDAAAAQDAVQSVFARLLERPPRDVIDVDSYVRRAVVNEVRSVHRRRALHARRLELLETVPAGDEPPDAFVHYEDLRGALGELTFRQRAVVVLRYFEGLDDHQIAAVVGCRPATVRSVSRRALVRLRHLLQERTS